MRSCGQCRECCIVMGVDELKKPDHIPCEHLCAGGCGIYDERPETCRNFSCAWLSGQMPSSLRPDKTKSTVWMRRLSDKVAAIVWYVSVRRGFSVDHKVLKWALTHAGSYLVIVNEGQRRDVYQHGRLLRTLRRDEKLTIKAA